MGISHSACSLRNPSSQIDLSAVSVWREGRVKPVWHTHPELSSAAVHLSRAVLEDHFVPACVIQRHEHVENRLHVVPRGSVRYEVRTRGKTCEFAATSGTRSVLPHWMIDAADANTPRGAVLQFTLPIGSLGAGA